MASDNGQLGQDSFEIPDETIRRFLLGGLTAFEQPAFEHRLLLDHDLAARVRLAEFELADDYAFGRLSGTERELMDQTFLVSADREQKIKVSLSLRHRFPRAPVSIAVLPATKIAFSKQLRSFFRVAKPVWKFGFAAAIFIVLVGAVWLVVKEEPRIKQVLVDHLIHRRSPTPAVPLQTNHPSNTPILQHEPVPASTPGHDQPAVPPVIVSITIMPSGSLPNGETPSVMLPKGDHDSVRLQLALKPNQSGHYRAELLTAAGQSVFRTESVSAGDAGSEQITFEVPARLLSTGNYQIRLGRDNATEKANTGSYYFRVQ